MDENPLGLDPEAMRRLGYWTVDMLADQLSADDAPPNRRIARSEIQQRLSEPPFNTLVHDLPGFGDRIRRAVRERLPGF